MRVRSRESGQAAVEAALTLPLTIFIFLGTLQLFLMLHARILTQYAAFRATRTGSVNYGDCRPMRDAALATVLPAITRTDSPQTLARAFDTRRGGNYSPVQDRVNNQPLSGTIVDVYRESPSFGDIPGNEDSDWDTTYPSLRLETRVVFWFPMKIPFANWVMTRMFLAHFALQSYNAMNPLMPAQRNAGWPDGPRGRIDAGIGAEYRRRVITENEYVFPIQASYSMRMMTPARRRFFRPFGPCG